MNGPQSRFVAVRVEYDRSSGRVNRSDAADEFTPQAYLRVESTRPGVVYRPGAAVGEQRGRYVISLGKDEGSLQLDPAR